MKINKNYLGRDKIKEIFYLENKKSYFPSIIFLINKIFNFITSK